MIRYMGIRKTDDGGKLYVFIVNGQRKEVKEANLKQHPGCYEALPASVKEEIAKNRAWLSRLHEARQPCPCCGHRYGHCGTNWCPPRWQY